MTLSVGSRLNIPLGIRLGIVLIFTFLQLVCSVKCTLLATEFYSFIKVNNIHSGTSQMRQLVPGALLCHLHTRVLYATYFSLCKTVLVDYVRFDPCIYCEFLWITGFLKSSFYSSFWHWKRYRIACTRATPPERGSFHKSALRGLPAPSSARMTHSRRGGFGQFIKSESDIFQTAEDTDKIQVIAFGQGASPQRLTKYFPIKNCSLDIWLFLTDCFQPQS